MVLQLVEETIVDAETGTVLVRGIRGRKSHDTPRYTEKKSYAIVHPLRADTMMATLACAPCLNERLVAKKVVSRRM